MNADEFWRAPPWTGGTTKYRLGLRPLLEAGAIVTPASGAECAHKQALLDTAYPAVVATTDAGRCAQDELLKLAWLPWQTEYADTIANAAAGIAEDLCLIDLEDEQRLIAGCVCAPSYWTLAEKIGRPLHAVHAPATGLNAVLGTRIQRFMQGLPVDQPFRRQNWFFHGDNDLFHPVPESSLTMRCSDWVMRSEVQTLYKLSSRHVLFAIRIICLPLRQITGYEAARRDLLRALASMTEDEVAHFGGEDKLRRLLRWLKSLESGES